MCIRDSAGFVRQKLEQLESGKLKDLIYQTLHQEALSRVQYAQECFAYLQELCRREGFEKQSATYAANTAVVAEYEALFLRDPNACLLYTSRCV